MRRKSLAILTGLFAAFGVLVILVTATPLVDAWAHLFSGRLIIPPGQVLVILSSSDLPDGIPDASSYWRAAYGIRAWRRGSFQTVVVSGGNSGAAIKEFLVSGGVPASAIVLESRSRSTRENALASKPILDALPGGKVLLTSDYHILRARLAFRKAGIDVIPGPIPDVRKRAVHASARWGGFLDLCYETAKLAGYFLRGWI